jgi:hypothetical protein
MQRMATAQSRKVCILSPFSALVLVGQPEKLPPFYGLFILDGPTNRRCSASVLSRARVASFMSESIMGLSLLVMFGKSQYDRTAGPSVYSVPLVSVADSPGQMLILSVVSSGTLGVEL